MKISTIVRVEPTDGTYAVATALSVLGNGRASGRSGLRLNDCRSWGGRRYHGRSGSGSRRSGCVRLTNVGRKSIALVDHGGGDGAVLDGVATREGLEIYEERAMAELKCKEKLGLIEDSHRPSTTSSTLTFCVQRFMSASETWVSSRHPAGWPPRSVQRSMALCKESSFQPKT